MELRVLRYFLAAAREGNITAAADFLHLTQPTLSRQLKDLEQQLGKKLFTRGSHSITLTEEGLLLRKRAEELVEMADKLEAEFQAMEETVGGDVYIGSGETEAVRLIAETIQDLRVSHPQIRYHILSGNEEDVTERLDRGALDFGVLIEPANLSKYTHIPLPVKDTWGVIMRKDSPLAKREFIQVEDLLDVPLLVSRQTMKRTLSRNEFVDWFGEHYDKLNIAVTFNLIYNAAIMVEEGLGYAVTLDKLVNTSGDSPLCFLPLKPRLESGLSLVWRKHQVFSAAAERFRTEITRKLAAYADKADPR
ncbi:LysR family transcriptional regulator [Saccharibacillus qingshengii]|uniref:LysR family transcriptional regulator n=1 Tax=Saccharibacillus qingshengii TaxID=1763540 RepID=UPI0015579A45|nr:LysR family transcriptional regulator [Saccharibacillus qingshengii]